MKNNPGSNGINEILTAPAHAFSGVQVLRQARSTLELERGYKMTLERVARLIGKETSTAGYWFNVRQQDHILGFISVLERLSEPVRSKYLNGLFRPLPSVLHPRIAHSPTTVGNLLNILAKDCGLTVINGGTSASRTFVLCALGHTFPQIDSHHRTAGGLDIHMPTAFVPCETVVYLRNPINRERARQIVLNEWPGIQASSAPLVLLNGIWSMVPELRDGILNLARKKHVVLADALPPQRRDAADKKIGPVHVLTLTPAGDQPYFIKISCQSPRVRTQKMSHR